MNPHQPNPIQNPLDRWRANEVNQQELSAFLVTPTGRSLVSVLQYMAAPNAPLPAEYNGLNPIESRALQYSEVVGYNNCLANIHNLTSPNTPATELPRSWSGTRFKNPHLIDEDHG